MINVLFAIMLLLVSLLLWSVFELQYQRDFWKEQYCYEITKSTDNHLVCGEK